MSFITAGLLSIVLLGAAPQAAPGASHARQNPIAADSNPILLSQPGLSFGVFGQGTLAQAEAEESVTPLQRFISNPLILPIGLLVLFYVIFLGPERRRKADEAKLLSSLKKNDRVVTIGGIHATVASAPADSDIVTLKIDESSNTRIRVNRTAIARIVTEPTPSTAKAKDVPVEAKDA